MPCNDWGSGPPPRIEYREDTRKMERVEAMLCAVLTVAQGKSTDLDSYLINHIDEKESGVTRGEVAMWWKAHQEKDRARRRREQAEGRKKQLQADALRKLSPDERKALGF